MCVCMCACMCACTHVCNDVCVDVFVCVCVNERESVHARACKHVCACVHKSMHAHTYAFKSLCCLVSYKYLQLRQIQAWQLLLQVIKVCHHSEENNNNQVQPQQPGTPTTTRYTHNNQVQPQQQGTTMNCNHCNRNCQTCTFTCDQTKASTNLLQTAFCVDFGTNEYPLQQMTLFFSFLFQSICHICLTECVTSLSQTQQ